MTRTRLTLTLCSLALIVASSVGLAQSAGPGPAPGPGMGPGPQPFGGHGAPQMPPPGEMPHGGPAGFGPGAGILQTLNELQRLYNESGRGSELPALYNEVLGKTQNPMLRQELYRRLARAQLQPSHLDAAIATLRKGLDEGLASEARMEAEHHRQGPPGSGPQAPSPTSP